jgi:hypothetical protein
MYGPAAAARALEKALTSPSGRKIIKALRVLEFALNRP